MAQKEKQFCSPIAIILSMEAGFKKDINNGLYTPEQGKKILAELAKAKAKLGFNNDKSKQTK